jgi:hypothetical protein
MSASNITFGSAITLTGFILALSLLLILLQDVIDGFDDCLARVGLAVNDDLMDAFLGARHVDRVLLGETVVPEPEEISIFLKGPGKLSASQLLDIDEAFGAA